MQRWKDKSKGKAQNAKAKRAMLERELRLVSLASGQPLPWERPVIIRRATARGKFFPLRGERVAEGRGRVRGLFRRWRSGPFEGPATAMPPALPEHDCIRQQWSDFIPHLQIVSRICLAAGRSHVPCGTWRRGWDSNPLPPLKTCKLLNS